MSAFRTTRLLAAFAALSVAAAARADAGVCTGVGGATVAPGWLLAPLDVTGTSGGLQFTGTAGTDVVVVVQNGDGQGNGGVTRATVSVNGRIAVSFKNGSPLAAGVATLQAQNGLEVANSGGGALRVSLAPLSALPCPLADLQVILATEDPQSATRSFGRADARALGILVLTATDVPGAHGTATVNGKAVTLTSTRTRSVAATAVPLGAVNTLELDGVGNPAGSLRAVVFDADTSPPALAILQPAADDLLSGSPVTVAGTVGLDATSVDVGGTPAVLQQGAFSAALPLPEGRGAAVASARDACGNVARQCRAVRVDTTPPTIAIGGVRDGQVIGTAVTPVFSASDAHLASVAATLDGAPFQSGTPVAAEGAHLLVVTARDLVGNTSRASVAFTLDYTRPTITVAGVWNGLVSNAPPLLPTFGASDPNLASLTATLNGIPFQSGAPVVLEGDYELDVTAIDLAGNTSLLVVHFALDYTAPALTVAGVADGAFYATPVTPTYGAGDPHLASVSATLDGAPFSSGDVVSLDGTHLLVVTATDLAGNQATDVRHFTLDFTPPQIAGSGVVEGQVSATALSPAFTVTDAWLASVVATLDGLPFTSGAAVSDEGDHALAVVATDRAGNVGSFAVHFAIDRTPPLLTVSGVTDGQVSDAPVTVVFGADDPHLASSIATVDGLPLESGATVTAEGDHVLVVTASDLAGNQASTTIRFSIDYSAPVISVDGVAPGQVSGMPPLSPVFSATDPHLASVTATLDGFPFQSGGAVWAEGDHVLVVTAIDTVGHTSETTVGFSLDFTPPTIQVAGVLDGDVTSDTSRTPVFGATDEHLASVTATLDGLPFASGTPVSGEGLHLLVVSASDLAGNPAEMTVRFELDRTPPAITISGVSDGYVNHAVVPAFTATDPHLASVVGVLDGAPIASGTQVSAAGPHALVITALDQAGNGAVERRDFTIDLQPPTLVVEAPADGSYTQASSAVVIAVATDDGAVGSVSAAGTPLALGADGKYRAMLPLVEGANGIEIIAFDAAGNSARKTVTVRRDTAVPALSVSAPAEGATLAGASVLVTGSVTDASPVAVTVGGTTATVAADGSFSQAFPLQVGDLSIPVIATDAAGNQAAITRHVHVNNNPLQLTVVEPPAGFVATSTTIAVRGSATQGTGGTTVTVNGVVAPVAADGSFTASVTAAAGQATVTVVAGDSSGAHVTKSVTGWVSVGGSTPPDGGPPPGGTPSTPAPVLMVDGPADGAVTNGTVAVSGRIQDGTPPFQVTVLGLPASVNQAYFSAGLALVEGDQVITIVATDASGRAATAQRTVSVDRTAPYLAITRPSTSPAESSESPYLVEGTAGDVHLASVTVAGQEVSLIGGQFSAAVPLQAGDNAVPVVAKDLAGNTSQTTLLLHVSALPPMVTILAPAEGSESPGPVAHVRAQVTATSTLSSVTIGTGAGALNGGAYEADVPLALGDNTVTVTAQDANGLTGSASVRVHYSDPTLAPLAVTGVAPAAGAGGVESNAVVAVSFNKPIDPSTLEGRFTVRVNGAPLAGGYYVAPGAQTVSFVAKAPLASAQRHQVTVSGVAPASGPGMEGDFSSDFTTRAARTRVHGVVLDDQFQPVSNAYVEAEGTGISARTSQDGNWTLFDVPAGAVVVRFDGGTTSDGLQLPTIRRRLFVNGTSDTEDANLIMIPVDGSSAQYLDASAATHLTFAGRQPALSVDLPANALFLANGKTSGLLTATRIPPYATPVPVESRAVIGGLWQVSPAGSRLTQPATISMPNLSGLPPGRLAVVLTYDPTRHMLQRTGIARVSDDGAALSTVSPVNAGSLELFGYQPLSELQSGVLQQALWGSGAPAPGVPPGSTGMRPRTCPDVPLGARLARALLFPLDAGNAFAQLGVGGAYGIGGYGSGFSALDSSSGDSSGFAYVTGKVRAPQELRSSIDLGTQITALLAGPTTITLPYALPVDVTARGDSPTAAVTLQIDSVRNGVQYPPVGAARPPAFGPVQGLGVVPLAGTVPLALGQTDVTVAAVEGADTRTVHFEATVTGTTATGSTPPTYSLTVKRVADPADSAEAVDATTGRPSGISFFKNWKVTVTSGSDTSGVTNDFGAFSIPVFSYGDEQQALACTDVNAGTRWLVSRYTASDGTPRISYDPVKTGYPICSMVGGVAPGSVSPVSLVVDMRLIAGSVRFMNKDGTEVGGVCDSSATTEWQAPGVLRSISPDDVGATEIHFFRDDNLTEPIARYSLAVPGYTYDPDSGQYVSQFCDGTLNAHAKYARLRFGPTDHWNRLDRQDCASAEAQGQTNTDWYRWKCVGQARINGLQLSAGDRLVIVAVNHATGYAGVSTVTVPPVTQGQGLVDGRCQADDDAGGPEVFTDFGQRLSISRCTTEDIRINANLLLYPPEIDVRVARQVQDDPSGVQSGNTRLVHLVRHGGAATSHDDYIQVATHWRVRKAPCDAVVAGTGTCPPPPAPTGGSDPSATSTSAPTTGIFDPTATSTSPPHRVADWDPGSATSSGPGAPGELLEVYCSQLPRTPTAAQLASCADTERLLMDMPAGVPPIYGQVVRVTGSAVEQPAISVFPVRPGQNTANLQTAFRYIDPSSGARVLRNLPRANYYVNVVGNQVFFADANGNGILEPSEALVAPPALQQFSPTGPVGSPAKAVPLKDVYRSYEPDGSLVERFDRAREHEFRVLDVSTAQVVAQQENGDRRVDQPSPGQSASAQESDLSYRMLLSLLAPDDPGRAGTLSGTYGVRLGTENYGIDCGVKVDAVARTLTADCGGEYLYDVLAANDILYFELFLSGNAENVLYRYNFYGLAPRNDLVTAGHSYTSDVAVQKDTIQGASVVPAIDRPISQPAMAEFFVGPGDFRNGTVRVCLDSQCSGTNSLLKQVDLRLQGDGTYQLSDSGAGRDPTALQTTADVGLDQARRFMLPLTPDLAQMPGSSIGQSDVFLLKTDSDDPTHQLSAVKLGRPAGGFSGAHARAPGQARVGGVNLADGHVSIRHEDFSVTEFVSRVGFSRTYNNQDNEIGTLGIGWRHNLESYVVEETVGRYAMVLEGQSYDFPRCSQVDPAQKTATGCVSDNSHGGSLTVSTCADGTPRIEFQAPNGNRYRFDRASRKSRPSVGRRRWVLTAFEDNHGRPDPADPTGCRPGPGWTIVQYVGTSDLVQSAARNGGKLQLTFGYQAIEPDSTLPRKLRTAARTESFALLRSVTLAFQGGASIGAVTFGQDGLGNLQYAEWVASGLPPARRWQYTYEAPDATLAGDDAWAQLNELHQAELLLDGVVQERTKWSRLASWSGFHHERKFEIVSSIVLPGSSTVSDEGAISETPLVIDYLDETNRRVTRPDGVTVDVVLNEYGNVKSQTVAGSTAASDWFSDTRGGQVTPSGQTAPTGRGVTFQTDDKLREKQVTLSAASAADSRPVSGVPVGQAIATMDPDPKFGTPRSTVRPTASGKKGTFATPVDQGSGDPLGLTVTDDDYGSLFAWTPTRRDAEGVTLEETDPVGRTVVHSGQNAWGLMTTSTLTLSGAASGGRATLVRSTQYDALGRVTQVSDDAGHQENWIYDGVGRLTDRTVVGEPTTHWHYAYTQDSELSLTVVETLDGTAHQRTKVFKDGRLWKETFLYGAGNATAERLQEYAGGRLVRATDERGVLRVPHYDDHGRVDYVDATAPGASAVREVQYVFDDEGKVLQKTDQNGLVTSIAYDQLGRASRWDYGSDDVEEAVLDANGVASQRKFGSHIISTSPDALGRVRSMTSVGGGHGVQTTVEYDALGRKTHVLDGETGLEEWFEYQDVLGRLTKRTRKVLAGSAQLQLVETRAYQDSPGSGDASAVHQIQIATTIDTGSGQRLTSRVLDLDAAGRTLQVTQNVLTADGEVDGKRLYHYDPRGNVIVEQRSTTAPDTLATWNTPRDAAGYLLSRTEPGGFTTTYVTDGAGLVADQRGPLGAGDGQEHWTYHYDAFGQVTEKKLLGTPAWPAATWTYAYRLADATAQEKDPLGYVTKRTYNARYKLASETRGDQGTSRSSPNAQTTTYAYDGPWLKDKVVVEGSSRTEVVRPSIDDRGRVLQEVETWSGGTGQSYRYSRATSWAGRVADPVGESWAMGSRTESRTSRVEVDSLGNLVSRTQGSGTDAWVYDAEGKLAIATPAGKPATVYGLHQDEVVSATFGDEVTQYRYFPSGKLASVTEPSGRRKVLSWFDRGLLETEEYGRTGDTDLTSYTYDAGGNVATRTVGRDADAQTWTYAYGPRRELLSVTQPGGLGSFTYGYDASGALASIQSPTGGMPAQTFDHDYLGRPVLRKRGTATWQTTWADGTSITVDSNTDTVVAVIDGRGRRANVSWQPGAGSTTYTDLTAVEYAYDGLDQLLYATESRASGEVTTSYQYDARSRLTRVARSSAEWVAYGYTGSDERLFVQSSAGQVTYGYDSDKDRLSTVDGPRGTTVHVTWETGGERLVSLGDDVLQECRIYDNRGRLGTVANLPAGTSCTSIGLVAPYAQYDYGYDERGNRISETYSSQQVTGEVASYGYDAADRLVGVQYGDGTAVLYGLAGDGTRSCEKRVTSYGGPLDANACDAAGATEWRRYAYDAASGGLSGLTDASGATVASYTLDGTGRPRVETRGPVTRSYGWDAGGRLTQLQVTRPAPLPATGTVTATTRYGYDFGGLRVSKTDPSGGVTTYLWGAGELVEERQPGATLRYENAAGLAIAAGTDRLMHDALSSVVGRIGNAAPVAYRFDAWGGYRGGAPGAGEPSAGYAGQAWDGDAGLSYAQQRWYDATTGRFLSEDPVFGDLSNPNSLHAFGYAYANPLLFTDPTGMIPPGAPTIGPPAPVTVQSVVASTKNLAACYVGGVFKANDPECADYWYAVGELPVVGPMIRGTIQGPIGLATGDDPWTKFMLDCRGEGNDCSWHPQVRWKDGTPHWIPMSKLDPTRQGYADAVMGQSFMLLLGAAPGLSAPSATVGAVATSDVELSTPVAKPAALRFDFEAKVFRDPSGNAVPFETVRGNVLNSMARARARLTMGESDTLARLDIEQTSRLGRNSGAVEGGTNVRIKPLNPVTRTHAEAEAFQRAVDSGSVATDAVLWVDRPLCVSCGKSGGVGSLMRAAGVDRLLVVTPDGPAVVTAARPSTPAPVVIK